jgi:hypothetical protein
VTDAGSEGRECAFCGSDAAAHDDIELREDGERVGRFCNYACVRQYVEREELETGACCQVAFDSG